MGDRLVVVSNRVPLASDAVLDIGGPTAAAVAGAAGDMASVLWFGWSGRLSGDNALKSTTSRSIGGAVTFVAVDLTESEYDGYLNGFSRGTLLPLLHALPHPLPFPPSR